MASVPTLTAASGSRTIHVMIHRYTNVSSNQAIGFIERTRTYYIKVTISNVTYRTTDREVDGVNQTVTWNEEFIFDKTTSSSMTLRVYRRRSLGASKLVDQLTVELRGDAETAPSALPRSVTFLTGPKLEFSLKIEKMGSLGAVDRHPGSLLAADNGDTQGDGVASGQPKDESGSKAQEEVAIARQALNSQSTPTGGFKRVLAGVESFRGVVDDIAEVHPFARIAYAIFRAITDPLIEQLDRDEQVRSLLSSFADFCNAVNGCKGSELDRNKSLRDVLKRAGVQLTEVAYFVQEYCKDGSFLKRAVKNKVLGMDQVIEEYRIKLDGLKEEFGLRLSIETAIVTTRTEVKIVLILNKVDEIAQSVNLEDLNYVLGAGLNTDKLCLVGTRTEIIDDIIHWASLGDSRVLLLCGGAGTGKSSIAHTVAVRFQDMGRLGSMFCFSRSKQASRTPETLFPHIARDLADLHPNIRIELCKAITNKADRTASGVTTQFEKLVLAPVEAIRAQLHGPILIVIDALDESGTIEERKALLDVLTSRLEELPPNFRVLITARPARDIEHKFGKRSDILIKRMEDIPSDSASQDIAKFVASQFADDPDVGLGIRQDLITKAQNLFQWAFVACQFILGREPGETALVRYMSVNPPQNPSITARTPNTMDISEDARLNQLYRTVLSEALLSKRRVPLRNFLFVMSWVLSAFEPLSCKSLSQLIAASSSAPPGCEVEKVVAPLGLLLSGVDDHDAPIAPLHISFRDFLADFNRSGEFFVDLSDPAIHTDMTWGSLSVMKLNLKFNICQLPTSHIANKDIPNLEGLIKKHIPAHLIYACRFWTSHFCLAPSTARDWGLLTTEAGKLVETQVLYWLEVLSLLGKSETGLRETRKLISSMKVAKNAKQDILDLFHGLELFWSYFAKCVSRSAPHIYVSALPFAPKESLVAKKYKRPDDKTLSIPMGQLRQYPACLNVLHGHADAILSVSCSPDGTRIVSGSYDNTIRIWNMESGEVVLGPLYGHSDLVRSVTFSPDGTRIVSGSDDATIRIWDSDNGKILLGPLRGHTARVISVIFSPDGSRIISGSTDKSIRMWDSEDGQMVLGPLTGHTNSIFSLAFSPDGARIISGSADKTIRIWNAENGEMVADPLNGHTNFVNSVAFSPDSTRIISGSSDKTIRMWDAEKGQMILGPLTGHTEQIHSVAFSPDGTRLISGSSDKTIRIWNVENGDVVLELSGHTDPVYSVAFSPDGTRIISGSRDYTVRIWNLEDGEIGFIPPNSHNSPVLSVSFSPDGTRIASCSDDETVRVWNARDGEMVLGPLSGHTNSVLSVALSPNGTRIVSGSEDETVRIWDAGSGQMLLDPLEGHTAPVWSVAFSPDGSRVLSGSFDETIRIWDAENGQTLLGPLLGHNNSIWSAVFSPDGSRIASGSDDRTVRIWNAVNGEKLLHPLDGHTRSIRSVAFSSDGTRVISGSEDQTIRVWSAETGQMLLGPLYGHTGWVTSVAFSPDGIRIISASADRTIRVWNAENGEIVLGPLHGHTNWILSAAFSPDGTRCVSGSHDSIIRVWDLDTTCAVDNGHATVSKEEFSTNEGWLSDHTDNWIIEDDWVLDGNGELLFYIPPIHRLGLHMPRTLLCIGASPTHVDLAHFTHGSNWEESFSCR